MTTAKPAARRIDREDVVLWLLALAPVLAWIGAQWLSFLAARSICATGNRWVLFLFMGSGLVATAAAGAASWRRRDLRPRGQRSGSEVRRFLALGGVMLAANLIVGTAFLVGRIFEFRALHCMWNSHAYGSITWTLLGLHTINLLTSLLETAIVLGYFLFRQVDDHYYLDARLDGVFWYFIVVSWIPLYVVVFLVPRLH